MLSVVLVRDIVRGAVLELPASEHALRGSYDLFHPDGAVQLRGMLAEWQQNGVIHTTRVTHATLGEVHPGERVLVKFPSQDETEWWVCDVLATDGDDVAQ
jgi:hypothetical protein